MISINDCKCSNLVDVRPFMPAETGILWVCLKRESLFSNIEKHCSDCDIYKSIYEKICGSLNEIEDDE